MYIEALDKELYLSIVTSPDMTETFNILFTS